MGEVCAEVTAVTEDTVTIGDVTFIFAGAADAGIEVGDDVCVAASQTPTGDAVIVDIDITDDDDTGVIPGAEDDDDTGGAPGAEDDDDTPSLPDTGHRLPAEPGHPGHDPGCRRSHSRIGRASRRRQHPLTRISTATLLERSGLRVRPLVLPGTPIRSES